MKRTSIDKLALLVLSLAVLCAGCGEPAPRELPKKAEGVEQTKTGGVIIRDPQGDK